MPEPLSPNTGFGMKHGRLAVGLRDLVDDVFVDLHGVGDRGQRPELDAKLVLSRRHLVVVLLGDDAHVGHRPTASRSGCPAR